jgi:uroporphyrinogen-III synthase
MKSLFISKELEPNSVLLSWCEENNIYVEGKSFLTFESISVVEPQEEIYFFTSKRAVFYFLEQHTIPFKSKIATVGKSTANELEKWGYSVDFIGETSGDPSQVARDLFTWSQNSQIAIIGALDGSDSIYNNLPKEIVVKYPVYKTYIHSIKLNRMFDYYVFTSPSNFKGFIQENQISDTSMVVAWGETTKRFLLENNIHPTFSLSSSSEEELLTIFK